MPYCTGNLAVLECRQLMEGMMILLLIAVFFAGLFIARYGSPTGAILCGVLGMLIMIMSEIAQRDASAGHPWVRADLVNESALWNIGLFFLIGTVIGIAVRIHRRISGR